MPMPPPPFSKEETWPSLLMDPPSRKQKHAPLLSFFHQIAYELPYFAWFPECDIVCLMPNSQLCFALTKIDFGCAPKQIEGLVGVL